MKMRRNRKNKKNKFNIEVIASGSYCPLGEEVGIMRRVLRHGAAVCNLPLGYDVAVYFCGNDQIRSINRRYRNIDKVTDVLSFPVFQRGEIQPYISKGDMGNRPLGDIIICLPRCREQAAEYGHSDLRELCFLALHGFLHLLGYDHETDGERAEMEAIANNILKDMGVLR